MVMMKNDITQRPLIITVTNVIGAVRRLVSIVIEPVEEPVRPPKKPRLLTIEVLMAAVLVANDGAV